MRLLTTTICFNLGLAAALAPSLSRQAKPLALETNPGNYSTYYFDQAIDHFPSEARYAPHLNGTFKQRYFIESSYYASGGPVFVFIGGEVPIDYYAGIFQGTIFHDLIQQYQGIGIVLENRYYGESYPFATSTTDELLYMTTEQTIADLNSFAKKVILPGFENINAPKSPWIVYGGSLAGALSAFTMKTYGNTYYAGISSSGVIHAQVGYPQWYDPIQKLAPQDCVASINNIIDKMDMLVETKQTSPIQHLKEIFGLGTLQDIRDFAQTIAFPLGGPFKYPTMTWQELNWNPEVGAEDFFYFCRNVSNVDSPSDITQVDYELAKYTSNEPWTNLGNYAAYIKSVVLPLCPSGGYNSVDCFGTQYPNFWADATNGYIRSYMYTSCTEFGAYQVAQPKGQKSLVSRVLDVGYTQQWCNWSFPKGNHNSIPLSPNLARWNIYGGLNVTADRLLFIDGSADPWKDLCYHSDLAPEREWSDLHPEHLINGAGHVWDFEVYADIETEPQFIREAHYLEIRTVKKWLKEFPSWKPGST